MDPWCQSTTSVWPSRQTVYSEETKRKIIATTTGVKGIFATLRRGCQSPRFTVLVERGVQGMEEIRPHELGAQIIDACSHFINLSLEFEPDKTPVL